MTSDRWSWDSRTETGLVRKVNEDAYLGRPDIGLWAVADGMGGHQAGDIAARTVVEHLGMLAGSEQLSAMVTDVEVALQEAHRELQVLAAPLFQTVGSTVAALLLHGQHAVCAWVGDTRIYRRRGNALEQLTQDHAVVEDMVERGHLQRHEAQFHPQANVVTRAVGTGGRLDLDLEIFDLHDRDIYLLCSDGLVKEVPDEAIRHLLADPGPLGRSDALVELALSQGARDNVTVATVEVLAGADGDVRPGVRNAASR